MVVSGEFCFIMIWLKELWGGSTDKHSIHSPATPLPYIKGKVLEEEKGLVVNNNKMESQLCMMTPGLNILTGCFTASWSCEFPTYEKKVREISDQIDKLRDQATCMRLAWQKKGVCVHNKIKVARARRNKSSPNHQMVCLCVLYSKKVARTIRWVLMAVREALGWANVFFCPYSPAGGHINES